MIKGFILFHTIGLFLGVFFDLIIGDPHFLPHPVRAMGSLIYTLEKKLLGDQVQEKARNPQREKRRGFLLWLVVMLTVATVTFLIMAIAYRVSRYTGILAEAVLTCYILAARSLCGESMKVYRELERGGLTAARKALSMIVGRDTDCLSREDIIKAAVETVAENTSDGVIAPFLYTALGGPVLGMSYKAVNTMDSMLGYNNDRYGNFGRFAARADDFFNYLPSRISAVLMVFASFILGLFSGKYSAKRALRIWLRDRYNHKSPNSAQTESVCAGAMGLKLGGTHLYRGIPVEKPFIGDEIKGPDANDIKVANCLMFGTEIIAAVIVFALLIGISQLS